MATSNGADTPAHNDILALKPPNDVIIPPPAIREWALKSADWVYRKGPKFEEDLKKKAESMARLSFVKEDDPYHAYYAWLVTQLREGKGDALLGHTGTQSAQDNKPKGPPEPTKFRFSARMPNISAQDLEIVKLTALYTARNGENWLKELRNKETGNVQFDFLRPTHSFFQFFRAIIDQYKILLEEDSTVEARIEELRHNVKDRFHILERAKQRAEYTKYVSRQKEKEAKKKEDEAREYASIDWHDFTVLNTVVFDERDENSELPEPQSLNDLQSSSLEQKASFSLNKRIEEAAPDDDIYYNISQPQQGGYPGYPPAAIPTPAPPVQPVYVPPPMASPINSMQMQNAREEEERRAEQERVRAQAAAKPAPGSMRIRNDYVPRAAAKKAGVQLVLCPNCKQNIPANEYDEHVRIELLDPRWKEQRQKADARYATTIVNTGEVANNLKRFASQRDDIYDGVTGLPISEEEAARRKKAATSYDGQPDPTKDAARIQEMQSLNVQEQLRRIQERHGGK